MSTIALDLFERAWFRGPQIGLGFSGAQLELGFGDEYEELLGAEPGPAGVAVDLGTGRLSGRPTFAGDATVTLSPPPGEGFPVTARLSVRPVVDRLHSPTVPEGTRVSPPPHLRTAFAPPST